jgi:hypothetical protein
MLFLYPREPEYKFPGPIATAETDVTPVGATHEYVPAVV